MLNKDLSLKNSHKLKSHSAANGAFSLGFLFNSIPADRADIVVNRFVLSQVSHALFMSAGVNLFHLIGVVETNLSWLDPFRLGFGQHPGAHFLEFWGLLDDGLVDVFGVDLTALKPANDCGHGLSPLRQQLEIVWPPF